MIKFFYTFDLTVKQFHNGLRQAAKSSGTADVQIQADDSAVFVGEEGTYFFFADGRGEFFATESEFNAELSRYGMEGLVFIDYVEDRKAA